MRSKGREAYVPPVAIERLRAELGQDADVVSVMLVDHAPGTEPTTFKPGVLRILVRDDAGARVHAIAERASIALDEYAAFVPVVCLTLSQHEVHPLRNRGGGVVVPWRST